MMFSKQIPDFRFFIGLTPEMLEEEDMIDDCYNWVVPVVLCLT